MALSPLLLKSLFGCVSVAGVGTAASFTIYQAYSANPDNTGPSPKNETTGDADKSSESVTPPKTSTPLIPLTPAKVTLSFTTNPVVLVKAKSDFTSTSKLSVESAENDYKCKVSGDDSAADFCKLVKLDFTNNWIDVNGIKKANSPGAVSATDLNGVDNHFKLEINQALYDKVNLSSQNHVEIISTATPNKTLAKLNVSFKVSDAGVDYVSTNYALGKALPASVAYDASKNYECPFSNANPTTESVTHACAIYPFGSTAGTLTGAGYHKQEPTDLLNTKATDPLTQDHYYILNYTTPVTKSDLTAHKSAYINKNESSTVENVGNFKNLVPVITQGTTNKKLFILSDTPSYSIIVKKSTQLETGKTITHTSTDKNYKCKLSPSDVFDCDLVDLNLSDSKTLMNVADIKNTDLTSALSIEQSDAKIKYFKLDVPFTQFETIKTSLASTPSGVELVDSADASAKIGDLTPIFAIDNDNVPYFQKSTFLVKNSVVTGEGITGDGAIDASKTHYCSFSTTGSPSETTTKCELIDLGSGDLAATTTITDTATTDSLVNTKNYLVKFIASSNAETTLAKGSKDANNLFFVQEDVDASNKKIVAKFNNQDIKEALVVEGDSSKKHLFILA